MMLLVSLLLASCGESKLDEAADTLSAIPVFLTNDKVEQKIVMTDDAISIVIPDQGELTDHNGNPVDDEMMVNVFFRNLFNNNITLMVLGNILDTEKGGNPLDEFLTQVEKHNKQFEVEYKGKKYKLPVELVRTILTTQDKVSLPAVL